MRRENFCGSGLHPADSGYEVGHGEVRRGVPGLMGVDIALFRVEQKGTSQRHRRFVRLGVYFDRGDRFAKARSGTSLPMLARVDPYGSLILTSEDMEQFVNELVELSSVEGAGEFLEPILELAAACAAGPATELHLDGD